MLSIFRDKLLQSISGNDAYIGIAALIALVFLVASLFFARAIEKRLDTWHEKKNVSFSKSLNVWLNVCYSMFTTLITLFPLFGMFGTVMALLGLDLSAGDMANIQNNFFDALTSTAWGIVFAGLFKLVHAAVVNYIEEQIEGSKLISVEDNVKLPKEAKLTGRR